MTDVRHRFDRAAVAYDEVRPGYPREVADWLCAASGVAPGDPALDLGAGTGLFARRLVEAGLALRAVEPNERMRDVLARRLPGVPILAETAEDLSLPDCSVALVTVAQAFHWFEQPRALEEIRRVLRPGGVFAVVWVTADPHPISKRVDGVSFGLLERQGGSAGPMPGEPLGWEGQFDPVERREFPFVWKVPAGWMPAYVGSFSVVANLPTEERAELLADVETWPGVERELNLPYRVEVNLARRRPGV